MRTLLLLPLLLSLVAPAQDTADSSVAVVSFKWSKSRQVVENLDAQGNAPVSAMTTANKNFERNARVNDPAGRRDPNADTLDTRSAALEKSVQDAKSPASKPVDGFAYRVKIQNKSAKAIEVVFWEYEFTETANLQNVTRRQFLCGAQVKPDKERELQAFSLSGPSGVVSAGTLANKSAETFKERVLVNRVEYTDGTIWQRKDWNFAEVKSAIARATATPWGTEMCRAL
ncbi:MAG: hypothetical protein QOE33_2188 [Acidobacteriota bacterium]|nr:hypothetical protein [Acidobacteriota bacterium]